MSLHSREASCSRQSPSTLERKEKDKGRAIRRLHRGHSSQRKPQCSKGWRQPSCSPEVREARAHQDDQAFQLRPERKRKGHHAHAPRVGKVWEAWVFLGLLRVRLRDPKFYLSLNVL